ncbi:hypothetical protein AAIB33_09880 [Microbacterium sp. AZCO]|uniref:hypothetical protein n=1 Tax=Microbacterium sp. AZCO TaxID=3142976 RepID=UPI0031F39CFE
MTVVVLDANAMPHGHFNEKTLRQLWSIIGRGSAIIVPEVVVWEWAEHAFRAQVTLNLTVEQHRVDPKVMPGATVSAPPPISEVVTIIQSILVESGVEIWTPSPEHWRDAVRQQVLQVGTGEMKKEVKTGAADGVVLACASEFAYRSEPPVVLLSSDSRLRGQATKAIEDLLVANGTRDVLKQLNSFEPAPEDLEVRASEVLPGLLNERIAEGEPALAFDEFGVDLHGIGGRAGSDFGIQPERIDFRRVDLVEFHHFEIASAGNARFGLGEMRMFGEFELAFLERRETSSGDFEIVGDVVGPFAGGYVDVTVAIRWDISWQFEDINATGVAIAVLDDGPDYDEEGDEVPPFRAVVGGE